MLSQVSSSLKHPGASIMRLCVCVAAQVLHGFVFFLVQRNVTVFAINMGARTLTLVGQTRENPNTFPFGLLEFCVDSVATCFSHNADRRCVPIGLSSLSALLLLLSCFLYVYQMCTFRKEAPGGTISFLYSFIGNLCSTIGAILSRQLHIQVLMGAFAAAVDAVSFIACCFHVLLYWNSKAGRRLRMMRGRRRQHLLAVCVLMVVAGGFLKSRVTHLSAERPLSSRRRLLHTILQDNVEVLGYMLGLLSCVIACTSRFPALCRAYRGQMFTWAYMFSGLLCSLAGALYAAAILLYDTQFGFLLRVMPWLLSAICCVTMDLLILVVHWWKRGTRQQRTSFFPDTESLLSGSRILTADNDVMKRPKKQQVHSSTGTKTKNVQKMTEMGCYMDVTVQPAGKKCLKEVMSLEEVEDRSLNQNVRVDSFCSSDTSCDSSLVSSDLEWDFEEANAQWIEPNAKQQEEDTFPPQERLTNPKLVTICTCSMFGLPQKTQSGKEEGESVSSASLAKWQTNENLNQ
ncbi:transmembrane protein 44 isoform X2 [Anoplopoma fimbria]|uniref:transmembrane protein 44 isoform X2 n=1 Tax=Anoplopoma fimbria TaxID=229290 RepID=UPI0023EBE6BF|nr:transmembrane protein 44 isoform X2 [Anoplopoma fimbria]